MNVETIREALTLAQQVVWESVSAHVEFDKLLADGAGDMEAIELAVELSGHYDDCEALVAIDRALKELALPGAGEPAAGEGAGR